MTDKIISKSNNPRGRSKSQSKVILFYYASMRSTLLYDNILRENSNIFDCVIEMPAIPYSRNKGKRDIRKIFRILCDSPGFFFMTVLTVKVFAVLSRLFRTSIKDLCGKNNIDHYYF